MGYAERKLSERAHLTGDWWTTEDVCLYCHVTVKTLSRWRAAGKLQGYKAGRRWLYKPDDVRALVQPQGASETGDK